MSAALSYERVREHLGALSMEAALSTLDVVLEQGQKQQRCAVEILDDLLGKERTVRFERRIQTYLRLSGITHPKTLESFDFEAQPQVPRDVITELSTLRFVHAGENVLFLGPPGVGKSHLAVGLALKTIAQGHRVYFLTLHDLVTKSRIARSKNRLNVLMDVMTRPALLVLDEIGYLPLEQQDATFLFEAVSKRYESQKSVILTSNKSFADWGDIFPDPILATALLDRLLHHATTLNIRGESYRLKHRRQAGLPTSPPNPRKGETQMPS